jgi:hypothetical protein
MVAPKGADQGVADSMHADKETTKKMNMPKPFTGKRNEYKKFMQDVALYLRMNHRAYTTDEEKIIFTLSFFEDGDAASWKAQYVENILGTIPVDFGNWATFKTALDTAFLPYDGAGDALEEMKNMRLGTGSIENHVANFKLAVSRSGLDKDSAAVVDYFRESLTIPLQKRIMTIEDPPTDLDGWCKWAMKMDANYKKMQRVIGRSRQGTNPTEKKKEEQPRRWYFPKKERDPNAMDIDAINTDNRSEAMRRGLCFGCGEAGHINANCPKKQKGNWRTPPTIQKKMNGRELAAHIRKLTAELAEEEKEQFYAEAEKEGF